MKFESFLCSRVNNFTPKLLMLYCILNFLDLNLTLFALTFSKTGGLAKDLQGDIPPFAHL